MTDHKTEVGIVIATDAPRELLQDDDGYPLVREIDELRTTGLLWLINATVFHPRGYALTFVYDTETDDVQGWSLQGDGQEVWAFDPTEIDPEFRAALAFLTGDHGFIPPKSDDYAQA